MQIIKNIDNLKIDIPIFAQKEYLQTFSNDYGWITDEKYLLPFVIRERFIFKYATFTHQTISILGINDIQQEKEFLNDAVLVLKKTGVDFITQPPTHVLFNTVPDNSVYASFGTYTLDLTLSEETILKNIHSRPRQYINSAKNYNINIETGDQLLDICHKIISKTHQRQGISFMTNSELSKFSKILKNNIAFFASKHNNTYQSAIIIMYDKNEAYYMYGGKTNDAHNASNYILHWEAIIFFKSIGLKKYKFVGARINPNIDKKKAGIQKFKERFGGELHTGFLWKYDIHPIKRKLYSFLIHLKYGKKNNDIIDEETR